MLASFPKVPKNVASKIPENRRFRLPHCRLTPPLQRTPANIRINLITAETRVIGLHFRRYSMGLSSFSFCGWPRKTHLFCKGVHIGHSRSSKVVDFGPIERAYATSY